MPAKLYRVKLTENERIQLKDLVFKGKAAAHKRLHAQVLLSSDETAEAGGKKDKDISNHLQIGVATVERIRQRFVEQGIEAALERKVQENRRRKKLNGDDEAFLIATACTEAPEGHKSWTLRLLSDSLVENEIVETISHETVRQVLKKNELKPWLKSCWCIPPKSNADFVCAMEDVLDVYQREYSEEEVLVCMDETSKQHTKETREPLSTQPGKVAKFDYVYERNGVSNLFMLFAPLQGWRHVKVTDRHTKVDWAELIKQLVDEHFPQKRKIVLVMDNLNTHKLSSLYEAFEPTEARRIAERLEIHYTPKHGSWLDMAEIEIGVMSRQCLDRRIEDQETLRNEINAWQRTRNAEKIQVNWRFTTSDARIKLKSLYPSIQS